MACARLEFPSWWKTRSRIEHRLCQGKTDKRKNMKIKESSKLQRAVKHVLRAIEQGKSIIDSVETSWRRYGVDRHKLWKKLQIRSVSKA
jgi:hypothetical protein